MVGAAQAERFPSVLPLFVVPGAILLPSGRIPLMVYEPRYVALVDDALGDGRLFGLVQPRIAEPTGIDDLHPVGTLARISAFGETGDGRYLITAAGITRFRIVDEMPGQCGYLRAVADYSLYRHDLTERTARIPERERLVALIRAHLGGLGVAADLDALEALEDAELADRMAMACPFSSDEKQLLLEAPDQETRCHLMISMIQKELLTESGNSTLH